MIFNFKGSRGFTLIELLIVIAIVAILSVVVLLTLNPAQLLKQARDSNRVSDMATLKSALALYLSDVSSPDLDGSANIACGAHTSSTTAWTNCNTTIGTPAVARFATTTAATRVASTTVTGTGWIPVNFGLISSGSPISVEPLDGVNNASYFYAYAADNANLTYEINARMESTKFQNGGSSDAESTDGGNAPGLFEVGTDPGLDL
jgi:prepilin-type N-terminal cleavage/methylation domain-containing protein